MTIQAVRIEEQQATIRRQRRKSLVRGAVDRSSQVNGGGPGLKDRSPRRHPQIVDAERSRPIRCDIDLETIVSNSEAARIVWMAPPAIALSLQRSTLSSFSANVAGSLPKPPWSPWNCTTLVPTSSAKATAVSFVRCPRHGSPPPTTIRTGHARRAAISGIHSPACRKVCARNRSMFFAIRAIMAAISGLGEAGGCGAPLTPARARNFAIAGPAPSRLYRS